MKTINKIIFLLGVIILISSVSSCKKEEDESDELSLTFKNTEGYTFTNLTLISDTAVKVGVVASTKKAKDPIIRFNISESLNGSALATIYSENLETAYYEYDFYPETDTTSGNVYRYIFTITNKDGKIKQNELTLSIP